MSEEKSFDEIFNGDEPTPTDTAPVADAADTPPAGDDPAPQASDGPARGPDGKFIPKGDKEDAPPASDDDRVPITAIQDERRKRQELERRLAEYEQKLQQLSNPPAPPVDMFDDPTAWQSQFGEQVIQSSVSQASLNARLDMSEMMVAQAHDDFDDMRPKILEFMDANPAVRQEILAARHPWAKAYQMVKNNERAKEIGATDIDSLKAAIRAELEAELKAQQPPVDIPQTLATAQSGRTAAAPSNAPPTLQDILVGR